MLAECENLILEGRRPPPRGRDALACGQAPPALAGVLVGVVTALAVAGPAQAGVYRCTSAAGAVYYSDMACAAEYAREELDIRTDQPKVAPLPAGENPYSLVNQARAIERREASERRRALLSRVALSPDEETTQRRIQDALAALDHDEQALQADLAGSSLHAGWAKQDLLEIQAQRNELRGVQANLQARMNQAAAAAANARATDAEARARQAEAWAADAAQRARVVEAQALTRDREERRHEDQRERERDRDAQAHKSQAEEEARRRNQPSGSLQALPKELR